MALATKFDKILAIMMKQYHKQFSPDMWKVLVWVISILSMGLES